jgi:effector-binding domain-containing protein
MLDDVKESLKEAVRERISSPLLGSYILFSLLLHWRAIVVLIWSEQKGLARVNEVAPLLPNSFWSFALPTIGAIAFSFGYPLIKSWYARFLSWVEGNQLKYELNNIQKELIVEQMKGEREMIKKRALDLISMNKGLTTTYDIDRVISLLGDASNSHMIENKHIDKMKMIIKETGAKLS